MSVAPFGRNLVSHSTVCRLLPHQSGDGPANMGLDDALLSAVATDPSMAVVRTYEWTIPTLSLGYFQTREAFSADARWSNVPIVRRPTGGGALWHEHEVTYAVVIPESHRFARPSRALYQAVHEAIARALQGLGFAARRRGVGESTSEANPTSRPFLCFSDRDEEDVVLGEAKLVGSAQRRRSGAILQHGSLLLDRAATTPELPGLANLVEVSTAPEPWIKLLRATLTQTLELRVIEDQFRSEELAEADERRRTIYAEPSWTNRR